MEIRQYWQVVVDRFAIVLATFGIAIVVAAVSVFLLPQPTSAYQALLSVAVRPQALAQAGPAYFSDDYYSYVASEFANDDLIAILQGDDFLQAVRSRLASAPGGPPDGSIVAKKAHRVVEITVYSSSGNGALALGKVVSDMLTGSDAQSYFALLTNRSETVSVVDGPRIVAQPAGRNALLNVVARSLVGLALGIALAFLVEYLDDTIRANEVESALGWPIVGEIPGRGLPGPGSKPSVIRRAEPVPANERYAK